MVDAEPEVSPPYQKKIAYRYERDDRGQPASELEHTFVVTGRKLLSAFHRF